MRRSRLPPHIVNHEWVACALEICSHLAAHRTQADEAYLHVRLRIVAKPGWLRLSLLLLVENGLRYASRSYGRRPSRIKGQVRDQFADFVLCHAVGQRTADMHAELFRTVQSRQRRDGDKAAIALGQSRTFPDVAKDLKYGITCRPNKLIESMIRPCARLPICMKQSTWFTPASWYFFRTLMMVSGVPIANAPESTNSLKVLPTRSC